MKTTDYRKKVCSIPEGNYQGYIWLSDNKKEDVTVLDGGPCPGFSLDPNKNPFIVEGNFYDKDKDVSYAVRYTDGNYIAYEYDCKQFDGDIQLEKMVPVFTLNNGCRGLLFARIWVEKDDPYCLGFPCLEASDLVFVGFHK